jgi:hypothetical protein
VNSRAALAKYKVHFVFHPGPPIFPMLYPSRDVPIAVPGANAEVGFHGDGSCLAFSRSRASFLLLALWKMTFFLRATSSNKDS